MGENSWQAVRSIKGLSKTQLFPKSHQGNKTKTIQHKGKPADKNISKTDVHRKQEQVTILLWTLCNVRNKKSLFLLFSKIKFIFL